MKVFNVYGYNTCGNDSICLAGLWRKAGLKVAPARLVGHCVTQVFYDGAWHLMDGDMHSIYLLRDNETVAGEQDLVRDHDLIRRTHTQGILQPDRRAGDEWESSIYVFEGKVTGDRNSASTAMNMTLRPGEAIVWRWGHLDPIKYHGPRPPAIPRQALQWTVGIPPGLHTAVAGARRHHGRVDPRAATAARWRRRGRPASSSGRCRSPYVFVGGRLEVEGTGATVQALVGWQVLARGRSQSRRALSARRARAVPVLPEMRAVGRRTAPAAGESSTTSRWPRSLFPDGRRHERVHLHRPVGGRAPGADHPPVGRAVREPAARGACGTDLSSAGGVTDGTGIVFQWRPAGDPDGDAIADYHFELSGRADMKWPLSMSFAKLISRTADAGQARYTLPGPGLLNPDTTYFWRVRAQG